jgi:hypothetical protein
MMNHIGLVSEQLSLSRLLLACPSENITTADSGLRLNVADEGVVCSYVINQGQNIHFSVFLVCNMNVFVLHLTI